MSGENSEMHEREPEVDELPGVPLVSGFDYNLPGIPGVDAGPTHGMISDPRVRIAELEERARKSEQIITD